MLVSLRRTSPPLTLTLTLTLTLETDTVRHARSDPTRHTGLCGG